MKYFLKRSLQRIIIAFYRFKSSNGESVPIFSTELKFSLTLKCLKETPFHKSALHVINYDFGDIYLYDKFIVGEFRADVTVTWEKMGKVIMEEIISIYGPRAKDLIYISNRVNQYSIIPTDWIKFFKQNYTLRGYGIVSYTRRGYFNAMLEKVFVRTKIKWFDCLESAIQWAREG